MGFGAAPLPILRFERFEPAAGCYLNRGITFSANRRIFFIAISCGMPPK